MIATVGGDPHPLSPPSHPSLSYPTDPSPFYPLLSDDRDGGRGRLRGDPMVLLERSLGGGAERAGEARRVRQRTVTGLDSTVTGLDSTVTGLDSTVTGLDSTVTGLDSTMTGLDSH